MQQNPRLNIEFICIMALLMALVALSIDGILPALPTIGSDFGASDLQSQQLLITMIFLGLGIGQLIFGPLSDVYGRKPMVYCGFAIFAFSSILCVTTSVYNCLILGRILQGFGLAAPRTLSIAMVRDSYEGDYMAKIMSFIVMIFIIVPVIAPTMGQFILQIYSWEAIFNIQLIIGIVVLFWFWKRQPETLQSKNRILFSRRIFIDGVIEFFKHKQAVVFTLISGFITGSFMVYLSSTQQIFVDQYKLGDKFPLIFASLAIGVGLTTYLNGILVVRFGMKKLALIALVIYVISAMVYTSIFFESGNPNLKLLLLFFGLQFASLGFLFGNLRSIAMQPIGHIAGMGAALNGFISTVMAVPIAVLIGAYVTNTALPLFVGFALCGLLSLALFLISKPFSSK